MHFKNENDYKTNSQHTAMNSASSSTSSTDSGVIIIDNHTTIGNKKSNNNSSSNSNSNSNNKNSFNQNNNNNHKINSLKNPTNSNVYCQPTRVEIPKDKIDNNTTSTTTTTIKTDIKPTNNEKFNNSNSESNNTKQTHHIDNGNNDNDECNIIKPKSINIENIINISKGNAEGQQHLHHHHHHQNNKCTRNNYSNDNDDDDDDGCVNDDNENSIKNATINSKPCSPTVSIRSTSISIVSIDENAIDSSIIDSDSEREADAEGVHSKYVVKKLGQQTTYPPGSKELPTINEGLTVIRQKINPNNNVMAENFLNIGSNPTGLPIHQLSNNNVGSGLATSPTSQQIGKIAVTNSTDVTFGDKHFYEGPVTIQQILIDRRDKYKADNIDGHDNPMFNKESDYDASGSKAKNSPTLQPEQPYSFIRKRKSIIITAAILIITLLICLITYALIPSKTHDDDLDEENGEFLVMNREDWGAKNSKEALTELKTPVRCIIISHTVTNACMSQDSCSAIVQSIQNDHMISKNYSDIGFNYLIGGDGYVYVGRSWNKQGAHTRGYNADSIGISFIGTFTTTEPTKRQIQSAKILIDQAVLQHKVEPDFCIYGARQFSRTESPGEALFKIIKTWPHWTSTIKCRNGN